MEITGAKNGTSTPTVSNMMAIVMRRTTRFQLKAKKKKKMLTTLDNLGDYFRQN
jgi:hypothetical protein